MACGTLDLAFKLYATEEAVMKDYGGTDLSDDARELLPEHDKRAKKIKWLATRAMERSFFSRFSHRGAVVPVKLATTPEIPKSAI